MGTATARCTKQRTNNCRTLLFVLTPSDTMSLAAKSQSTASRLLFASLAGASLVRRVVGRRGASTIQQGTDVVKPSTRIRHTDASVIETIGLLMRSQKTEVLSLAQGVVYWKPPAVAIKAAADELTAAVSSDSSVPSSVHSYGALNGTPSLVAKLQKKVEVENGIVKANNIMVTSGANQAFANLVVALIDSQDASVLFKPYYFNHLMAIQMTGGHENVIFGGMTSELIPDIDWLETKFKSHDNIKMVVIVNPGNPSGTLVPRHLLERAREVCAANDAWLVGATTCLLARMQRGRWLTVVCLDTVWFRSWTTRTSTLYLMKTEPARHTNASRATMLSMSFPSPKPMGSWDGVLASWRILTPCKLACSRLVL